MMTNDSMREKLEKAAGLLSALSAALAEIAAECGEVKVEKKAEVTPPAAAEKKEEPKAAEPVKKYTLEDVRKALAAKSGAGFTAEVRELLQKHGGNKLSAINEAEYASIMEEVQTIGGTQ